MKRSSIIPAALAAASLGASAAAQPEPSRQRTVELAHQVVAAAAIETLPKQIKGFYKAHRAEMPSLALELRPEARRGRKLVEAAPVIRAGQLAFGRSRMFNFAFHRWQPEQLVGEAAHRERREPVLVDELERHITDALPAEQWRAWTRHGPPLVETNDVRLTSKHC